MSQTGLSRGRFVHFLYPSLAALALAATACGPADSQSTELDLKTTDQALTSAPQQTATVTRASAGTPRPAMPAATPGSGSTT